jgi:hypothetical protein
MKLFCTSRSVFTGKLRGVDSWTVIVTVVGSYETRVPSRRIAMFGQLDRLNVNGQVFPKPRSSGPTSSAGRTVGSSEAGVGSCGSPGVESDDGRVATMKAPTAATQRAPAARPEARRRRWVSRRERPAMRPRSGDDGSEPARPERSSGSSGIVTSLRGRERKDGDDHIGGVGEQQAQPGGGLVGE